MLHVMQRIKSAESSITHLTSNSRNTTLLQQPRKTQSTAMAARIADDWSFFSSFRRMPEWSKSTSDKHNLSFDSPAHYARRPTWIILATRLTRWRDVSPGNIATKRVLWLLLFPVHRPSRMNCNTVRWLCPECPFRSMKCCNDNATSKFLMNFCTRHRLLVCRTTADEFW